MFIDTHAHVNFSGFKEDAESVIQRALDAGVWVVNVGTQIDTSREAVRMAEKFETGVFAVVGIHPVHTYAQDLQEEETQFKTRQEKFDHQAYKELASHSKVIGIGECGLDYFRLKIEDLGFEKLETIKQNQKETFIQQLRLASDLNKTLVIHSRSTKGTDDACLDILEILKSPSLWRNSGSQVHPSDEEFHLKGGILQSDTLAQDDAVLPMFILHSYTGSPEVARQFVDLGAYVSFNGIITFDKTGNQEAVLKVVPNDKIVLETDCPYLTPAPHRGKRNEPLFVQHVAEKIATIKNISVEEVAEITTNNARKVYNI